MTSATAATTRGAVSTHRARDAPPPGASRVRSAAPVPRRVLRPTTGLPTRTSARGDARGDVRDVVIVSAHRTGRRAPRARATGARDEVVPSVAVAPPDADEVDVLVRYVYPGVRFSQGKVVVLRARKTDGADRADPADDAAADDDDDDDGDGILGSASAAGSAPATVTGADVVAALRRDGVDVARWRPRVALRLGDPAAAAAASEDVDASRSRDDAWRRRPVVPGFVGWRALGDDDVVTFDVGSVGLLVRLEDALVADTVPGASLGSREKKASKFGAPFSKKGGGGRRRRRRKDQGNERGEESGEEGGDEDEPPREGEGVDEPPRTLRAADYRGGWGDDDDDALIERTTVNAYAGKDSDGCTARPAVDTGAGFFGIGIVKAKHEANVGTLWRSAWQLGAGFLFTVATRFKYEASDTTQAYKQLPLFKYDEWGDFASNSPHGAVWVAVEMGGVPLQDFVHPPRAVYVLGSEDNGLNRPIVEACQCHVALPKWVGRSASYNVAMAGTLVMYDRMQKQLRDGHVVTREGGGGDEDR